MSSVSLDTLRSIILDSQQAALETGVKRRLELPIVKGKASVCIGVRRCGKSVFMTQVLQELLDRGVDRRNTLQINFFDDRLHGLGPGGLAAVDEAYYSLYPEKKRAETVHFFLDEIQTVKGWEPFVERLLRTENCRVYITGSSAKLLSKEIATEMRGRSLSCELFPFSFREFLDYRHVDAQGPLGTKAALLVRKAFEEYWQCGGFPEVLPLDGRTRRAVHQDYLTAMLFRDVVERHDIAHPRAVSDLAHRLLENAASLYSVNSLTGYLKSLGHPVPKTSVGDYLAWFEDAYFMFSVRIFDASVARRNTNPKKIYCADHAFIRSVSSGILVNDGHLLENLVYTALRRLAGSVYYHKTASGREVDFILHPEGSQRMLVQVCETLAEPSTRQREISALTEAMQELSLRESYLVTRTHDESVQTSSGKIRVMPAWRFLLEIG